MSPRSLRRPGILVLVAPLLLAGCFSAYPGSDVATSASGPGGATGVGHFEVASFGEPRGEIVPVRCESGDLEHYLGGDLIDEEQQIAVRLVVDPLYGPALRVYDLETPFEHSVLFYSEDCVRFDMTLAPTGWIVNDVQVRKLDLAVECENEDGATIAGEVSARCD